MNQNTDFIPFSRPSIGEQEENAVIAVLRSGWLTTGRVAGEFEELFADFIGARFAIAVNSATAGLHLSLEASGIGKDDRVITTPYTFTATAETIRYLGAHPLFVDIEKGTFNIDPNLVENALNGRHPGIKGIIPVHIAGRPCGIRRLEELAQRAGCTLIEDCAHAFPVLSDGKYLGRFGRMGVFSFYANKTITTGEGGMIVTDDEAIAKRIKIMRLHGIDRESWNRYTSSDAAWFYSVVEAGYKYNLTDIAAAIGIEQLKKADSMCEKRKKIARKYIAALEKLDFIELPEYTDEHAWHLFIVRIVPDRITIDRDEFIERLRSSGIGTSVHYIPLHIMPYYKKLYGFKAEDFPIALEHYRTSISLPIYPDLTEEQAYRVIKAIEDIGSLCYKKTLSTPVKTR